MRRSAVPDYIHLYFFKVSESHNVSYLISMSWVWEIIGKKKKRERLTENMLHMPAGLNLNEEAPSALTGTGLIQMIQVVKNRTITYEESEIFFFKSEMKSTVRTCAWMRTLIRKWHESLRAGAPVSSCWMSITCTLNTQSTSELKRFFKNHFKGSEPHD